MSDLIGYLVSLIVIVAVFFSSALLSSRLPWFQIMHNNTCQFRNVQDRPLVETLDKYYELLYTGETTITIDGYSYVIFLEDLTYKDRRNLQSQLRTP